ncbi:MAG: hypothetical protein CVT48_06650 [Thermoplasmata archaeon HGW-Thermoplasmata-1]|nr:MAG: hypothetical protein CVT48_06650 [Thermoplasmata archaeon HGW-Thermoplasmata-1]
MFSFVHANRLWDSMNILVTGFEPFGEIRVNPSQALVDYLDKYKLPKNDSGVCIESLVLPVTLGSSKCVIDMLEKKHYDAVIHFGVAVKRDKITPERIAINCLDFPIPDNDGRVFCDEPIKRKGAPAYFSGIVLIRNS